MLKIIKDYPCSKEIYTQSNNRKIEYIVIHFTGDGDVPAINYAKCNQWNNAHRDASWHYCVGNKKDNYNIYQSVEDKDIAWHCGAKTYIHPKCRNNNSIGVEHCCYWKDEKAYFEEGTILASIWLVKQLMKKYNVPIENVIRHYDVTGKSCPQPFLYNDGQWERYLKLLQSDEQEQPKRDLELENALSKIIKQGNVQLNYNSWKRKDLIKLSNVPYLLDKLGGLDKLIQTGVVINSTIWKNGNYTVENVRSLIIKYSKLNVE